MGNRELGTAVNNEKCSKSRSVIQSKQQLFIETKQVCSGLLDVQQYKYLVGKNRPKEGQCNI